MKKLHIFLIIVMLLGLGSVRANDFSGNNISFQYFSQNVMSPLQSKVKKYTTANENKVFDKMKITKKTSKAFVISGGVCSGLGTSFLLAGAIMGFIPYASLPDEMKIKDTFVYGDSYIWRVDYPYMTAYGAAGISMIITGALLVLFTLPLLIYGSIALYEYNKDATVSIEPTGFSIKLDKICNRRRPI